MNWRLPRVVNSFLIWFIVILALNQIIHFVVFRFYVLKAPSEVFADLVMTVNDAVQQIYTKEGHEGIKRLKTTAHSRGSTFDVMRPPQDMPLEMSFQPASRNIQKFIQESTNGQTVLKISQNPEVTFWLTNVHQPDLAIKFQHKGQPVVVQYIAASAITILAISMLAAWWISRRLIKPLHDLSDQADKLRLGKELEKIHIDIKSAPPEINALANSFNEMHSELNRTIHDREQLLAAVTHDLRTPLSRLHIALDMMESSNPKAVNAMQGDIEEMRTILEQFVELAKLDAEVAEPWVRGDLKTFVGNIRDQYRRAGVNLRTVLGEAEVLMDYKPLALTRLVYNLIDNACRHGAGTIEISVSQRGEDISLTVSNPVHGNQLGTGLTEALTDDCSKNHPNGLGLRIARQFARVHHAKLEEYTDQGIKKFTLNFKTQILTPNNFTNAQEL